MTNFDENFEGEPKATFFDVNIGDVAKGFESLVEKSTEPSEDPEEDPITDPVENPEKDIVEDPENPENPEDPKEEPTEDPYEDYSDSAIIALTEIRESGWDLKEDEIPKDLTPGTLRDMYRKHNEIMLESEVSRLSEQAGEAAQYVEYLLRGGSPEVVQQALGTQDYVDMDVTKEENQKEILRYYFENRKGVPKEDISDLVDGIMDRERGLQRSQVIQEELKKEQADLLEEAQKEQEMQIQEQQKAYMEYADSIKTVINSGEFGGVKVGKTKQKKLISSIFEPTEIIEVPHPQTGQLVKQRASKIQVMQYEMNKDPEKVAAFYLWLLEGGQFDFVKDQAVEERDDSLRALLKRGTSKPSQTRSKSRRNAFEEFFNK